MNPTLFRLEAVTPAPVLPPGDYAFVNFQPAPGGDRVPCYFSLTLAAPFEQVLDQLAAHVTAAKVRLGGQAQR